jgi:hypothetical protein
MRVVFMIQDVSFFLPLEETEEREAAQWQAK